MKFLVFSVFMFLSFVSYAKVTLNQIKDAKLYLNTAPSWCEPCSELEKVLQDSKSPDLITLRINNIDIKLHIIRIDHSEPSIENTQLANKLGFSGGFPEFKIFSKENEDLSINPQDIQYPVQETEYHKGETLDSYQERLKNRTDISIRGLKSLLTKHIYALLGQSKLMTENKSQELSPFLFQNNILIAGTARTPLDNPAFTGLSIKSISQTLQDMNSPIPIILYGTGGSESEDTIISKEDKSEIVKIEGVEAQAKFKRKNLASFFSTAKDIESKNNLLVFVGHGTPEGSLMWFEDPLRPSELTSLTKESKSQNVLVSGNCYGGVMAKSVSCGFFGATPHVPSSGCWEDVETGKGIEDYTKVYFKALSDLKADLNGDGEISFSEAHVYAIINGEKRDTPYSSADALVQDYLKRKETDYNQAPTIEEIRNLVEAYGDNEDNHLFQKLVPQILPDDFIVIHTEDKETLAYETEIIELDDFKIEMLKNPILDNGSEFDKISMKSINIIPKVPTELSQGLELMEIDHDENFLLFFNQELENGDKTYTYSRYTKDEGFRSYIFIIDKDENITDRINAKGKETYGYELLYQIVNSKKLKQFISSKKLKERLYSRELLDTGNLLQLYKKMIYKAHSEDDKEEKEKLAKVRKCETQNVREFLDNEYKDLK